MSYKTLGIISLLISSVLFILLFLSLFLFPFGGLILIPYLGAVYCFAFAYPEKRKIIRDIFGLIIPLIAGVVILIVWLWLWVGGFSYGILSLSVPIIAVIVLVLWFISWVLTHPLYDIDLRRREENRWSLIVISLVTTVIYILLLILIYNGVLLLDNMVRSASPSLGPPYQVVDVTAYILILFYFLVWWMLAVVAGVGFINLGKRLSEQLKTKLTKISSVIFYVVLVGSAISLATYLNYCFSGGRIVAKTALISLGGIFTLLYLVSFFQLLTQEYKTVRSFVYKMLSIIIVFALFFGSFAVFVWGFDHSYPGIRRSVHRYHVSGIQSEMAYMRDMANYFYSEHESFVIDGISICKLQSDKSAQEFQKLHESTWSRFGVKNEDNEDLCYGEEMGWVAVAELDEPDKMWCVDHFGQALEIVGDGNRGKARPAHMPEEGLSGLEYRERGQGNSPCEQLQEE